MSQCIKNIRKNKRQKNSKNGIVIAWKSTKFRGKIKSIYSDK